MRTFTTIFFNYFRLRFSGVSGENHLAALSLSLIFSPCVVCWLCLLKLKYSIFLSATPIFSPNLHCKCALPCLLVALTQFLTPFQSVEKISEQSKQKPLLFFLPFLFDFHSFVVFLPRFQRFPISFKLFYCKWASSWADHQEEESFIFVRKKTNWHWHAYYHFLPKKKAQLDC